MHRMPPRNGCTGCKRLMESRLTMCCNAFHLDEFYRKEFHQRAS